MQDKGVRLKRPTDLSQLSGACEAFWQYWNSLPKVNHVPHIKDYLDHAPPALQPYVVIMDLQSAEEMSVRLMGTALVEALGELTGSSADILYSGQTREMAIGKAWRAVHHPCGYIAQRKLLSKSKRLFNTNGLVFPIRTDTDGSKTIVSYNDLPNADAGFASDDQIETVQGYTDHNWFDVGAGVPD